MVRSRGPPLTPTILASTKVIPSHGFVPVSRSMPPAGRTKSINGPKPSSAGVGPLFLKVTSNVKSSPMSTSSGTSSVTTGVAANGACGRAWALSDKLPKYRGNNNKQLNAKTIDNCRKRVDKKANKFMIF